MSYCAHGFGRCPKCDTAMRLAQLSVDALSDVQAIIVEAFGEGLRGSERGKLVSRYYLARIRDRLAGVETAKPPRICEECIDLRARLVNIYHLTLTYGDNPASAVNAIRAASGPGAPAPPSSSPASSPQLTQAELVEFFEGEDA